MVDRCWCQHGVVAALATFAQNRVSGRQTTVFVFRRSWRTNFPFSLPMEIRACGTIACPCCPSHLHAVVPYPPRDIHPVHDRAIVCAAMHHRMRSGLPSCSKQHRRLRPLFRGWQKCRVWAFAVQVEAASADQAYGMIGILRNMCMGMRDPI